MGSKKEGHGSEVTVRYYTLHGSRRRAVDVDFTDPADDKPVPESEISRLLKESRGVNPRSVPSSPPNARLPRRNNKG